MSSDSSEASPRSIASRPAEGKTALSMPSSQVTSPPTRRPTCRPPSSGRSTYSSPSRRMFTKSLMRPPYPPGQDRHVEDMEFCEVVVTADDADWLAGFTRTLVEERLAACGQAVREIRSIYRWQGAVHDETEARGGRDTPPSLL